ncbi:MAG: DegV family protein [Lachnospiraceae bacterium]|nr:DegV family protein [Lachnospiraceae bacterium]
MRTVKIFADSTCDLSDELLKRFSVNIIPLTINLGDVPYSDGVDIFPDDIYAWSDEHKLTPKTASPSIESILNILKEFDKKDTDIVYIGISEKMSVTCNTVRLAGEELENARLFVIDSKNLSTGIGLLVISAARLAAQGKSAEEIVAEIEQLREKVSASFVVDTLTYIHRGGRCSGAAKLVANTLKLKPEIYVENGSMEVGKKYRGRQDSVILKYAADREEEMLGALSSMVFITHSGCDDDIINSVRKFVKDLNYFDEIFVTRAGSVISSHCGPKTLGILFIRK